MSCKYIIGNKEYTEQEILSYINDNKNTIVKENRIEKVDSVYINKDTADDSTLLHEYQHLFLNWVKTARPELYAKGIDLIKKELEKGDKSEIKDIFDFVKQTQPTLKDEAFYEEILTELVGRRGAELLNSKKKSGIIDWIREAFKEIGKMLGLLEATPEQVSKMTLKDFADASAVQMMKGENFVELYDKASKFNNLEDFIDNMSSFRDAHSAPSKDTTPTEDKLNTGGDFSLEEVAKGFHNQPDDYYTPNIGARYYGYNTTQGMESFTAINNIIRGTKAGKGNQTITAYRAVPNGVEINELKDYDWVTFSKTYAKNHGESRFGKGEYKIVKQEVPITDLWWDGNDINEWGYDTGNTKKYSRKELKDIWGYTKDNKKSFQQPSNIRFQIVGEKGASKIKETLNLLDQAKQLENVGEDEKVIEQKTGWFKQNGDWKYFSKETLNSMFPTKAFINKAKIGQEYKLEEVLGSNKLFEYYPQLKDIKLKIYDGTKEQSVGLRNSEASYDRGLLLLNVFDNRGNGINPFDNAGQGKSKQSIINDRENFWTNKILPLAHEIQHIIQETENFPMGGNPFTIEKVARKLSNSPEGIPFSKFLQNVENTIKENKNLSKEDLGVLNAQKKSLEFFMKSGSRSDLPQQYKMLFGEFEARTVEYIKQKYTGNSEKLYTEIQDELALIESIKQEELIPVRKTYSNLKTEYNVTPQTSTNYANLTEDGEGKSNLPQEVKDEYTQAVTSQDKPGYSKLTKKPSLKIEVKEVNGRLVVEPLVNGTKAGALRMLPYEDGYRVDSVTVYDKYQNRGLGTRLYQEAIKFLLKSQTSLYSLKVRSENAKKIWDKFVEIGVAQKVGEDYIAPNKGGLDKNNEAAPSDVMQYANTTDEKLSKEETAEAIDLAVSFGVESSQEAVAILKEAFLENDSFVFDKKKMKKAGYNDYEITKILTDVNLQNQIKNNLAKLENTDFSAPLMDVQTSPEIGIFGKQKVKPKVKTVNVKTVNEQGEVVDKVSDTKELLRKTYPDTLPNDMPQIASSLFKSSENVVNTHNDLFYNTLNDLKNAALDLGVDLKDIENRVFPLENFKSFVNSLMEYYANPSDAFAEVYDKFFENYGTEKATKPTMSTPYTEYELLDKFNLVRNGNEYVKVEDVEIEPSAERQAKIPQLEVEDFAVDFDKLEKLVYHKEQLGAEMKTLQKPLIEEINLREVKKNPYLKATSEGVKLVSEDPLTAQKAELYGYEPKVAEKQPKKIETDYSLVQDVLVTQLTSENKVRTPKGNFTKFMDDNNKSVFLLDGSKQSTVDLEGYLSKADNTPKIEAKKLYSKEEFENNFGCLN